MAAAEDARMQTASWSTSEEQSLAAGPPPSSHAPPLLTDEHSPVQEPENTDYNRASSAGNISLSGSKNDTIRDAPHKQVKVLSFSLSPPVLPRRPLLCTSFFLRSAVSLSLCLLDSAVLDSVVCLILGGVVS